MAPRLYCCRTKVRVFFSLSLLAGGTLFLINIFTQVVDIPLSSPDGLPGDFKQRHEVIDKWRKERGVLRNKPIIAPVQCKGSKCAKFMGVLGMDANGGDTGSQHCKHPLFLSENDTIAHTFHRLPQLTCGKTTSRNCGYSNGQITVADGWSCLLQTIQRPEDKDSTIEYINPTLISMSMPLPKSTLSDHFRLSCVSLSKLTATAEKDAVKEFLTLIAADKADEVQFFTRISKYPDGEPDSRCSKDRCMPYNVLVLGIGSLSQMSFRRLLPKTYDYFNTTLKSVRFDGYNVVGHGASGALLPLLSGLDESKQPEARINHERTHYVDRLDLIWNAYDNHGYVTLYAEDHPSTNTFNGRFQGFEKPPTAHYMRPFWLAAESRRHSDANYCLGNRPRHQYLLDYLLQFHSAYKDEQRFAIAMLKELTESDVTAARHLDDDLLRFMKELSPHLDDTIVMLMSDHGVLPKQSLKSWQSKAEARMPLMSIYLPTSFITNYSDQARAMIRNEDKLITPYDIHQTLKDIIDIRRLVDEDPRDVGRFGQSLFKPLPVDRTCKSAGVDMHWCACHTQYKVQSDEVDTEKVQDLILTELNRLTAEHRAQCAAYREINVVTLVRLVPNEQIKEFELRTGAKFTSTTLLDQNYYQATIKVSTAKGSDVYDVTFEHNSSGLIAAFTNSYKLVSDIVKLSRPVNPHCGVDKDILRYCSCAK